MSTGDDGATARRWYRHGWNRPLSWELILRITPWLPRFVLVPLHHLTTLLCLACMPTERAAARRNLHRVTGTTGLAAAWLCYRLFFNFGRFLVAYGELRRLKPEELRERLLDLEHTDTALRQLLAEGRGVVLATLHIGQWDIGLKLLSGFGVPVHVVMLSEDPREITRYADEARAWTQLRVHQMGASPLLALELMAALRRGEIVAVQIDRAVGANVMPMTLFGATTELPTGAAHLAMATGAPVLPTFVLLDRGTRYRLLSLPPLRFERNERESALHDAMSGLVQAMEHVISRYPDQWFNFYDVWPQDSGEGAPR